MLPVRHGTVHPEVLPLVKTEFNRLHLRNPLVDGAEVWGWACDYAFAVCSADSAILREVYFK